MNYIVRNSTRCGDDWCDAKKEIAYGRPVGVAVAADGSLLVADDVGNTIWRVSKSRSSQLNGVASLK